MAKHTIIVEFYYPSDVKIILTCDTDNKVKKACFVVTKYDTEEAVDAYENSKAAWSVILDDDQDYHKFINEAYKHIKNNNLDDLCWLYKNFL